MKRIACVCLFVFLLSAVTGCDYFKDQKYKNKVFTVRTELGNGPEIVTWKDVTNLSYDEENYSYDFYVKGKLVTIDAGKTIVIIEQQ